MQESSIESIYVTHAIIGEEAGATKMAKIRSMNITMMTEDELLEIIRLSAPQVAPAPEVDGPTSDGPPVSWMQGRPSAPQDVGTDGGGAILEGAVGAIGNEEEEEGQPKELWVEKYRPKTVKDLCAHAAQLSALSNWLKNWSNPER
ncbi:hypothetical protein T484DRAFT_1838216 [Baffinella frigidus]|nr:hypothetical protein T484DRAFT_1838216 [Cryptophyta sp. CCMP2293]